MNRTDKEEEPLLVARALLPEEIDEGTKMKYEMLQYEIIKLFRITSSHYLDFDAHGKDGKKSGTECNAI